MTKVVDVYNRTIRKGDGITYPVRKGSAMWLADGRVESVNPDGSVTITKSTTGRKTVVKNTSSAVLATNSVRRAINAAIREVQ